MQKLSCQTAEVSNFLSSIDRATTTSPAALPVLVLRTKAAMSSSLSPLKSPTLHTSSPKQNEACQSEDVPKELPFDFATNTSPAALPVLVLRTKTMMSSRPSPLKSPTSHTSWPKQNP